MPGGFIVDWRCHAYYLVTIVFVVHLLLHQCAHAGDNYACGPGLESLGATIPEGDLVLENGSSLEIFCNLNLSHRDAQGYNASDLVFLHNRKEVEKEFIEILNETTIRLFKKDPPASKDVYHCNLKKVNATNTTAVCLNTVAIGYKPQEVLNFTCISLNWSNLTCRWIKPENPIKTKYSLRFHFPGRGGARMMYPCNASEKEEQLKKTLKDNEDLCFWDLSTYPHYRQPYEYYYFSMKGENQLARLDFDSVKFHHYSHVIPSPPDNLSAESTTTSVLLSWKVPFPMQNFPPGIAHRIEYQSAYDSRDTWHEANASGLGPRLSEYSYNLTGPLYSDTPYDIRVYIKSFAAVSEDKWSKPATVTVKTKPTIPGAAPRTDIGSFEVTGNSLSRDVYVYWQHIPDYLRNGPGFDYKVTVKENGNDRLDLKPNETTEAYAKFKGLSYNSYEFSVTSVNAFGSSEASSLVYLPSGNETPSVPISFTKIAFSHGLYELSWKPPPKSQDDIESYTVFWCKNERDRPYQCKGYLNWTHVNKNDHMINITVPENAIFQFAISANTKNTSSGMVWASCTIIHNKDVGKMKSVWINHIGSDFIDVGWNLECSDRIGRVQGYRIDFCPIVSLYNQSCKEPKQNKTLDVFPEKIHSSITKLRPYTTYMVSITILTNIGEGLKSDPLYNTTMEAAPSDAPRNVTVSGVTNTSVTVEWLPPGSPNGIIRFYKVYYNNSYIQVDTNNATHNPSIKLENLTSYVNYSITLSACTVNCSEKSTPVWVQTDVGVPGKMECPQVRLINSSLVLVTWKPPAIQGGTLNYYQVAVQQSERDKFLSYHKYNSSGIESQIPIPDCETEGFRQKYTFKVRAVNIGRHNQTYFGPWSDPGELNCYSPGPSESVVIAIWVFGIVIVLVVCFVFAYAGKRVWMCCKDMQNLKVKLPAGLDPVCDKEKDIDYSLEIAWPSDIHSHHVTDKVRSSSSADEELLLQNKEERHDRNPSGDTSGCSSGHESASSSLTSGTQISSDSGTEVNQSSPSADGVFVETLPWDRMSLRQRNVSILRPDGDPYILMNKGTVSVRSTPNLTDLEGSSASGTTNAGASTGGDGGTGYSSMAIWSSAGYISMPSNEEVESSGTPESSGYSRVGLDAIPVQGALSVQQQQPPQQPQHHIQQQTQSPPSKGYVMLSDISSPASASPSTQFQQPVPVSPSPTQSHGYVAHQLPWSSPSTSPKESPTGKGYVMAGERSDADSTKSTTGEFMMVEVGQEDDILDLEALADDDESHESYCRFSLCPTQNTEEATDTEHSATKPNSGYVALSDGPRPPDGICASGVSPVSHGYRTVGTTGNYVPCRQFEKRDTIPNVTNTFPESTDDSFISTSPTGVGENSGTSPNADV